MPILERAVIDSFIPLITDVALSTAETVSDRLLPLVLPKAFSHAFIVAGVRLVSGVAFLPVVAAAAFELSVIATLAPVPFPLRASLSAVLISDAALVTLPFSTVRSLSICVKSSFGAKTISDKADLKFVALLAISVMLCLTDWNGPVISVTTFDSLPSSEVAFATLA